MLASINTELHQFSKIDGAAKIGYLDGLLMRFFIDNETVCAPILIVILLTISFENQTVQF